MLDTRIAGRGGPNVGSHYSGKDFLPPFLSLKKEGPSGKTKDYEDPKKILY